MRNLFILLLCLTSLQTIAQSLANKVDLTTWKPPYKLIIPDGWTTERFLIPADFAPQIPYKGVEELRFAPGWGKRTSPEYWSYAYVWWIEGSPKLTVASLQENLTAYYSGLITRNNTNKPVFTRKVVPTTTLIKKVKTTSDGSEIYSGTINMLDYMGQSPITLNCLIHVTSCKEQKRTAVFIELSPKPVEHIIWQKLHSIQRNFSCKL